MGGWFGRDETGVVFTAKGVAKDGLNNAGMDSSAPVERPVKKGKFGGMVS